MTTLSAQSVENHEAVREVYAQYQHDRIAAMRKLSKIQRDLNRAEHEVHRVERYLDRIEAFCQQNDISLKEEK